MSIGGRTFVGRLVLDPNESMALVARPRSQAVGALAGVGDNIKDEFNLATGSLQFGTGSDDRSAQVARRIQQVWSYYEQLGTKFEVIPLPE